MELLWFINVGEHGNYLEWTIRASGCQCIDNITLAEETQVEQRKDGQVNTHEDRTILEWVIPTGGDDDTRNTSVSKDTFFSMWEIVLVKVCEFIFVLICICVCVRACV